jgi:predicted ATPase/DNA-binding winged helix-turn-helix (wHTH) protein
VSTVYEIGPFRLDPEAGLLSHAGLPMALGTRGVAVLTALVRQSNEYVRKESILDAAWPGVVVEEHNLAVQISSIRRVLAKAPGGEQWIETLSRRGYRFVGPVSELQDNLPKDGAGSGSHSNLPAPLTSFIGRERELVEIKRLLRSTRLLTVVGVGGIGKTRLALQAAAEVIDAYRDGVWLVELASITDPSLVATSAAQVLGVQEKMGTSLTDSLCAHLKPRQLLLILDNCEHLLDACATLTDIVLHGAAELTIIATSRQPLHVAGEQTYRLPTLSLPDSTASSEVMWRSEAVQLFVDRARLQQPAFVLTDQNAPAVAEVCIQLDGIPLALELAAARAHSLSIDAIKSLLADRFKLLTGGDRTALPRQQTLRATLDWSYGLLAEPERVFLRRLAIFAGGFTLEAGSSVASDAAIDKFEMIDLLSQLVARSLVVADTTAAGTRYHLLETTRAYALEKLAEAGETSAIERRHAQYFRNRFDHAADDWLRVPDMDWSATYLVERDNLRVALDWAHGAGDDPAIEVGLASASGPIWETLSLHCEGLQRLEAAVARVGARTPELDQARLWLWLGLLWCEAAPPQAVAAFERASDLYRRLGDVSGLGYTLVRLGGRLALMSRLDQAAPVLAEAFSVLERAGVPKALALYFEGVGFLKLLTGDLAGARMNYEKALSLYRGAGAERSVLNTLGNLADTTWALGDLDAALAGFRETVALTRMSPLTVRSAVGIYLANLAGVLTERGDLDEALVAAREGLPLLKLGGNAWIFMDHVALRAGMAGKVANAARLAAFTDSTFTAKETSRQPNEVRARKRLQVLLSDKLAPNELERLFDEGAKMSEDEACRIAVEE